MRDLKPCPFCGDAPTEACRLSNDGCSSHWIECEECGMRGPQASTDYDAVAFWNDLPRDVTPDVTSPQNRSAEHDDRRDRFTLAAMRALYAGGDYSRCFPDGLAVDAVRVADALIEELAKEAEGDE